MTKEEDSIGEEPEYRIIINETFDSDEEAEEIAEKIIFSAGVEVRIERVPSLTINIH